jgi:hypothetical protein
MQRRSTCGAGPYKQFWMAGCYRCRRRNGAGDACLLGVDNYAFWHIGKQDTYFWICPKKKDPLGSDSMSGWVANFSGV